MEGLKIGEKEGYVLILADDRIAYASRAGHRQNGFISWRPLHHPNELDNAGLNQMINAIQADPESYRFLRAHTLSSQGCITVDLNNIRQNPEVLSDFYQDELLKRLKKQDGEIPIN